MTDLYDVLYVTGPQSYWDSVLVQLNDMIKAAIRTGIRWRTKRGAWKWDINPVEYIQLTQEIACHAPAEIQEAARFIVREAGAAPPSQTGSTHAPKGGAE